MSAFERIPNLTGVIIGVTSSHFLTVTMLSNKKLHLYISVMSFWLLVLSSVALPYRLHVPSSVWTPIGSAEYPAPARVSNTHPGPFIHWDIQTITFKKNSSGTDDISGTAEFSQVNAAFWNWDGVDPQTIDFTDGGTTSATYSTSDGKNVVFWSDDFNDEEDVAATIITYASSSNPRLIDVDIALNDDDNDLEWTTGAGNYNTVFNVKAIVIHEVGHLLGLGHTDKSSNQIVMHVSNETSTLAQDDKDGINFLYGNTLKVPQTFQNVREALEFASSGQTVEVKSGSSVSLIGVHPSSTATVKSGVTLDVKSGATILFQSSEQLKVVGTLKANGTSANPITFKRKSTGKWYNILIQGGTVEAFNWCNVDSASDAGLRLSNPSGVVTISNSTFENCTNDGIRFDSASGTPFIDSCILRNNGDDGVQISNANVNLVFGLFCVAKVQLRA